MRIKLKLTFLVAVMMIVLPVSAVDYSGWNDVTINESPVNSSSTTIFSMKIPPGHSVSIEDTIIGPLTNVFSKTNPNSRISLVISDNPTGKPLDAAATRQYLDKFMLGAKISLMYGSEPQALSNGGLMVYGTSGSKTLGIYIMSTDKKVIIITGFYNSIQDATSGVETLAMLAGSMQMVTPITSSFS